MVNRNALLIIAVIAVCYPSVAVVKDHPGGLDAQGCHAGSKPYHCHRPASSMTKTLDGRNRLKCSEGSRSLECTKSRTNRSTIDEAGSSATWRGLKVAPELRCAPYNKKKQYPYSQSVEDDIVTAMGGKVYGPYSGRYFQSDRETDIEHIVAASEGHDSGLCRADAATKRAFATDLLNLTLAAPTVNRCGSKGKCGLDAGEWMPEKNRCWFANRVVLIKAKYSLTVDRLEASALEAVLTRCSSTDMVFH